MKKSLFTIAFCCLAFFRLSAESVFVNQVVDFSQQNPDKVAVLSGSLLCQPVRTSYGYVAVGEGKQIYGFTPEGKTLWQRSFHGRLKPFISVGAQDMLYMVTTDSSLNMMNTSGLVLWTAKVGFEIIEAPYPGRDGRVFVRGRTNLACYGLNGVCRWSVKTDIQNGLVPMTELNDGSLLVFLNRTESNKSIGVRYDIFGTPIEEIVFASTVTSAVSCSDGALLAFADGSIGLFSSNYLGETVSKWVIKAGTGALEAPIHFSADCDGQIAVVFGRPAKVFYINPNSGEILTETFKTSVSSVIGLPFIGHTVQGLVLCDSSQAFCYTKNGDVAWHCKFNTKKQWTYLYPTDSGYISFCMSNWVVESYLAKMSVNPDKSSFVEKKVSMYTTFPETSVYKSSVLMGPSISGKVLEEMRAAFRNGNFGAKEQEWIPLINREANQLYYDWISSSRDFMVEKPYFQTNLEYNELIFDLIAESGICFSRKHIASLLKTIDDPSLLLCLVRSAGKIAYDPDGDMLGALDYILQHKVMRHDVVLLDEIANSTYEICRFMGRPVFLDRGKFMIGYMMYPQFSNRTRQTARVTMKKILDIKL